MRLDHIKAAIVFLGPAAFDSRVKNLILFFKRYNIDFEILTFDWFSSEEVACELSEKILEIKLNRKNSFLFYFKFYCSLIKFLSLKNYNLLFVEEVYSLAPSCLIAKIKRAKIIYNSRELYPFLGGLKEKKIKQFLWGAIEKAFIKFCDAVSTTGPMDTEFIKDYYKLKMPVITLRNLPSYEDCTKIEKFDFRSHYGLSDDKTILLYVGILTKGRGIESSIKALEQIENLVFILLGDGDYKEDYQRMASNSKAKDRIFFFGRVAHKDLIKYIAGGDIGLCYIQNISKSYYYALPNKLFEFIMAGLPVIGSSLPQIREIIEKYKIGIVADSENVEDLITAIKYLSQDKDKRKIYSENAVLAAKELCWEKECETLVELIETL